jgi:hypothetical protein
MKDLNLRIRHIPLPQRMRSLPISDEGFPVPKFVPWIKGKPEFRGMDGEHMAMCVRLKRCWLCGDRLGVHMTFTIGPMCIVNRNIAEPPAHHSCAEYAVRACPFLSQPRARRNEKDKPEGHVAGVGLKRNPGVVALWTTRTYRVHRAPNGGALFSIGNPESVEYFCEGRKATRDEILVSMETGLPLLMDIAQQEGNGAPEELQRRYEDAIKTLVPA